MGELEQVQAARERLVSLGTVVASDGGAREVFPVAIGPLEGAALRERVVEEGAVRTFETGLGFAVSTLFICEACSRTAPASAMWRWIHSSCGLVQFRERRTTGWAFER